MAKLHSYHVLCPLIDRNSFLGISKDKFEENCIVSLGRNVINKYRLTDQKQIGGWTSKDHLTSPVIFDEEKASYIGVFNNNVIKIWKEDSDNLNKIKKFKFSVNIFKIIPRAKESSLIIFENGNCASLSYALDNRKSYENQQLIKDYEAIAQVGIYTIKNTNYICYIINNKNNYEILSCPLRDELGDMEKSKINRIKVLRTDALVVGKLISTSESPCIYFLWDDSKMTAYNLINKSWKTIGTVPWISTSNNVSIAWMGKNHLILFGSNIDQDGAIIIAYNVILGVGSCRYPMKMYSENAHLYCINNCIVLEASNHIGMLPFVLETNRNLSSLLGSHDIVDDNCTEITNWDTPVEPLFEFNSEYKDILMVGITERNMCTQIILPLLESKDFRVVLKHIQQFKDVPESVLIAILNYTLKILSKDNVNILEDKEFTNYCKCQNNTKKDIVLKAKFELLNYLFQIQFSDAILIPYMRNYLSLDDALFLLRYISYLVIESEVALPFDTMYESKLFDWCTLLMDSFYQQYLLTNDEKVSYVLNKMHGVVVSLINQLMVVNDTIPILHQLLYGKQDEDYEKCLSYGIEVIDI